MSSSSKIRSAVALSIFVLAGAAHANADGLSQTRLDLIQQTPGEVGLGVGQLGMPSPSQEGHFSAELQNRAGEAKYTIDAIMTQFTPAMDIWSRATVARGGVYGSLREAVPPGVHLFRTPPILGQVEGLWSMDNMNHGSLEILVYTRGDRGSRRFAGLLVGDFDAHEIQTMPAPGAPTRAPRIVSFVFRGASTLATHSQLPGTATASWIPPISPGGGTDIHGEQLPGTGTASWIPPISPGGGTDIHGEQLPGTAAASRIPPISPGGGTDIHGEQLPGLADYARTGSGSPGSGDKQGEPLPGTAVASAQSGTLPDPPLMTAKSSLRYKLFL